MVCNYLNEDVENTTLHEQVRVQKTMKKVQFRKTWSKEHYKISEEKLNKLHIKDLVMDALDSIPVQDNIQITINPICCKHDINFVDVTIHYFE